LAIQTLKSVSDGDQLEVCVKGCRLGGAGDPRDVGDPSSLGFGSAISNRPLLLVDRPYLGEVLSQREGDLTGATSKVQEPSAPGYRESPAQVGQKFIRVRPPVAVVERSGASIEVGSKSKFSGHVDMMPFMSLVLPFPELGPSIGP
jgi:hypothetical protein